MQSYEIQVENSLFSAFFMQKDLRQTPGRKAGAVMAFIDVGACAQASLFGGFFFKSFSPSFIAQYFNELRGKKTNLHFVVLRIIGIFVGRMQLQETT